MASVTYLPHGVRVECADGDDIFATALKVGIGITTACGAKATCGLCRVKIVDGERHLSPLNDAEKKHLGNVYFINKLRLSCQARVSAGDVTVEIPGAPAKK